MLARFLCGSAMRFLSSPAARSAVRRLLPVGRPTLLAVVAITPLIDTKVVNAKTMSSRPRTVISQVGVVSNQQSPGWPLIVSHQLGVVSALLLPGRAGSYQIGVVSICQTPDRCGMYSQVIK